MAECCFQTRVQIANLEPVSTASCAKYEDQGHQACVDWRDEGTNQCQQSATESYNSCSGWWRWLCLAWVTITYVTCISWYWVASWVCHAWMWIANVVCVAWHWVTYLVVVGFTWFVHLICVALLWPCLLGWRIRCRRQKEAPRNPLEKPGWILTFQDDFTSSPFDPRSGRPRPGTASPT